MNELYDISLKLIENIISQTELFNATNSQSFLDWLDKLNELSVKY